MILAIALANMVQFFGHHPANLVVVGSDSQSGLMPQAVGSELGPLVGVGGLAEGNQLMFLSHIDASLPFSLSPFPSL